MSIATASTYFFLSNQIENIERMKLGIFGKNIDQIPRSTQHTYILLHIIHLEHTGLEKGGESEIKRDREIEDIEWKEIHRPTPIISDIIRKKNYYLVKPTNTFPLNENQWRK